MAGNDTDEIDGIVVDPDEADLDEVADPDLADIEDDLDVEADDEVAAEGDVVAETGTAAVAPEAEDDDNLEELEAEELEMLTDDEASESIAVDEVAELRTLLREEREMDVDPVQAGSDEFVCQSCFLLKRTSQLADRKRRYCRDCVA